VDVRFVVVAILWSAVAAPAGALPSALHPIGRGPNTVGVCGNVVVHANSAIDATLHDDQTIERSIERLHSLDFASSTPLQHDGVAELRRLSGDLADTSAHGTSEVGRLRNYAQRIEEERQRTELSVFADALASALDRQQKMGADLNRFLVRLTYHEMRQEADPSKVIDPDPRPSVGPEAFTPQAHPAERLDDPNEEARATAADFSTRLADVRRDESHAADLSEAAVGGC
jgi:hypothetical protein